MTIKKELITTNQLITTAFGILFSVIAWLGVLQLTDIRDAIKDIKTFMVDQRLENLKNNGVIEKLKEKDDSLQKQLNEYKKRFHLQ